MNATRFEFAGTTLALLPSGGLFWPDRGVLCVSDLHLGRSERYARNAGALLPPYEVQDTLARLDQDIEEIGATTVLCLGDSFDDLAAVQGMSDAARIWLDRLAAGRRWIWIEGNHDPGPIGLAGAHLAVFRLAPLTFRHIADPGESFEISGHYHPKARLRGRSRPCLLVDRDRVILPAYGTYTGGLRTHDTALAELMRDDARAILTGPTPCVIPMPR